MLLWVIRLCKVLQKEKNYKFTAYLELPLKNRFNKLAGGITTKTRNDPINNFNSLDIPLKGDDENLLLIDVVEDVEGEKGLNDLIDRIFNLEAHKALDTVINKYLSLEEKNIIELYYYQGKSIKDIAGLYDYQENQVRSIKQRGLNKLER